ncbi:MAG TPA: alpha/beta hydrolase [Stellaceae bacterium]|jgi:pimeloyl-ACP methyl ester carboxylesterase|nr:alpha/beta hydrolase [Stellaceae bacterium]
MPHTVEMMTVAGARIRLFRGDPPPDQTTGAPPLVFLHGAGGHTGWMAFLEELSARFTVYAPEHPGFGQSDDPPWLDEIADLAYFHLDLLRALSLDRVHLVGTSLGGWVAAEMAVRSTAQLLSLTLVGAVGITAGGEPIPDIFRMSVDENLRRFYADPQRAARRLGDMARVDMDVVAKNRAAVMRLAYRPRFYNPGLARWLHRVDIPTLLLWGAKDGLVPPAFGEAYHALIPGSRLVVLPNAGHAPFDEQKDAFIAAFLDFIGLQGRTTTPNAISDHRSHF